MTPIAYCKNGAKMTKRSLRVNILKDLDLEDRSYLLTHCDDTSQLTVYIGDDFPRDLFGPSGDEVLAYLEDKVFHVDCKLDCQGSSFPTAIRYEIFKAHMANSILAIYKADKDLENILDWPLQVHYISQDPDYDKVKRYDRLRSYLYKDGVLIDFVKGFNFKKYFRTLKTKN